MRLSSNGRRAPLSVQDTAGDEALENLLIACESNRERQKRNDKKRRRMTKNTQNIEGEGGEL